MDDTRPQGSSDLATVKQIYREILARRNLSKHTILEVGTDRMYHTTKRRPWVLKEERRAKNKRSRVARKLNRQ